MPDERALLFVPNWIGDSIMAMPAVQLLAARNSDLSIDAVAKSRVAPLWRMHRAVHAVHEFNTDQPRSVAAVLETLRSQGYKSVFIMPNSLRAAIMARRAGIRHRIGRGTGLARLFLSERRPLPDDFPFRHQAFDYAQLLLGDDVPPTLPEVELRSGPELPAARQKLAHLPTPVIALLPGAARGPAKQWPKQRFVELGKMLVKLGASCIVLGSRGESTLCAQVALEIGVGSLDLSGSSLEEWCALVALSSAVVCNDSGGMHVANALGVPLVAIFGVTDPSRTGPLRGRSIVLQASGGGRREIARDSERARAALAQVHADQVVESLKSLRVF